MLNQVLTRLVEVLGDEHGIGNAVTDIGMRCLQCSDEPIKCHAGKLLGFHASIVS